MEDNSERHLDIGAGFAEYFIQKARQFPDKKFFAIDPEFPIVFNEELPKNLSLTTTEVTDKQGLPFPANTFDEIHINFVFLSIQGRGFLGEVKEEIIFPKLFEEALRVLKRDGILFIRDREDVIDRIMSFATNSRNEGISVAKSKIPFNDPAEVSLGVKDAMLEQKEGDQPFLLQIVKK